MVSSAYWKPSGTEPKTTLTLAEGEDYTLEEGAPVLTESGFHRIRGGSLGWSRCAH